MNTPPPVALASLSAAMDGGFVAITDVSQAMQTIGATTDHRLIGGVAVLLHVQRLGLDLPLRATGDADFGVPPNLLKEPALIPAIESIGYKKVAGNRWERRLIPGWPTSSRSRRSSAGNSRCPRHHNHADERSAR